MSHHGVSKKRWFLVPFALAVLAGVVVAPAVAAASTTAVATVSPAAARAGTTTSYTFTLTPDGGQVGSFDLTAPSGWTIKSVDSAPSGVGLATNSATVIEGRGLTVTSSTPLTVVFTAQAPCRSASGVAWQTVAKAGPNLTGGSVSVNPVPASTTGTCTAAFVGGRQPADAAFNANVNGPSENITSVAYTPGGAPIEVVVKDDAGFTRPGVSITLQLTSNPTGATLSGPINTTSDPDGIATFTGTNADPIAIDEIGLGYAMTPTGTGVLGTQQPDAFGVYQEGEPCASTDCVVHGHSADNKIQSTVAAPPNGDLAVLVADLSADVDCSATVQQRDPTYEYVEVSAQVTAWKYTGTGSQTITVFLDKRLIRTVLDRGSDHLDFCFLIEGLDPVTHQPKTFVDKFGVTTTGPSLLPDCNKSLDGRNCIVSETAASGGGRLVTVTVEDGKGRI